MDIYKELQSNTKSILNQVLDRDKHGGYVCPVCSNGAGRDGTGLYTKDGIVYRCYRCGFWGDIVAIVQARFNLNKAQAVEKCKELSSMVVNTIDTQKPVKSAVSAKYSKSYNDRLNELVNGQHNYNKANARFIEHASRDSRGLEYACKRGIPIELARRYKIGFSDFWNTKNSTKGSYIIIPNSRDSYNTRNIDPNCNKSNRYRKWQGYQRMDIPFNILNVSSGIPLFVTEGEFDALSIMAVGDYQAIAVNGNSIDNAIKILDRMGKRMPVILLLDNDSAGRDKTVQFTRQLLGHDYHAIRLKDNSRFYGSYKDLNDFLINDRKLFKSRIDAINKRAINFDNDYDS